MGLASLPADLSGGLSGVALAKSEAVAKTEALAKAGCRGRSFRIPHSNLTDLTYRITVHP